MKKTMSLNSANSPMSSHSRPAANIQDCLTLFTKEEKLDDEDAYYCASCKGGKKAIKKMDLWYVRFFMLFGFFFFKIDSFHVGNCQRF